MRTFICANSSNWWDLTEAQHGKTIMTSLWTDRLASTSLDEISNCLSELYCKGKVQWKFVFITQWVFITYNTDIIACPWERSMGNLLWIQSLIRHCCCSYNIAFRRIVLKRLQSANSDTTFEMLAHRDKAIKTKHMVGNTTSNTSLIINDFFSMIWINVLPGAGVGWFEWGIIKAFSWHHAFLHSIQYMNGRYELYECISPLIIRANNHWHQPWMLPWIKYGHIKQTCMRAWLVLNYR